MRRSQRPVQLGSRVGSRGVILRQINVAIDAREFQQLNREAESLGVTPTEIVRGLIYGRHRDEAAAQTLVLGGERVPVC